MCLALRCGGLYVYEGPQVGYRLLGTGNQGAFLKAGVVSC